MDIGEIESLTDLNFPHRNNGLPSYLPHQRETIIKILEAILINNKKLNQRFMIKNQVITNSIGVT